MRTLRKLGITVGLIISVSASAQNSFTVHKFGHAPNFVSASGVVTIWDGADVDTAVNYAYDYESSATISNISSTAGDVLPITIQGLDANSNLVSQTATLNGTNAVALATPLYRVFRAYNSGTSSLTGIVSIYPNTAITGGVPDDTTKIRAIFTTPNEQTEMAVYTIPKDHRGLMKNIYFSTDTAAASTTYEVSLWKREPGSVFRLQHQATIDDSISTEWKVAFDEPLEFTEGTDIELRVNSTGAGTGKSMIAGFEIEIDRIRYY